MKKKQITTSLLDNVGAGSIIAYGMFRDSKDGCNMNETRRMLPWVAVRGKVNDWAIYYQPAHKLINNIYWSNKKIASHGKKIILKRNVEKLVEIEDEVWGRYRY